MEFEVVSAEGLSDAQLCAAMVEAFSDYAVPMALSVEDFQFMMRQRGLDRAASRVAMVDGEIAAIWLASLSAQSGYLISSGTRPMFRGHGVARTLGQAALDAAKAQGVRHYFTEVMDGNVAAGALYERLGLRLARYVTCFDLGAAGDVAEPALVNKVAWAEIGGDVAALRDWAPTWQNDDAAMARIAEDLICVAVRESGALVGYAMLIQRTGVIAQIAVGAQKRRNGIGRGLIGALRHHAPGTKLRVLNAQSDDAGFAQFMHALGANKTVGQRAMRIELN